MSAFTDFLESECKVSAFAPGRTELAGNHVDHQGGCVIAATIAQGMHATACENGTGLVRVESAGFDPFSFALADMRAHPRQIEAQGSSRALVSGMVYELEQAAGTPARGFDIAIESDLPEGGGLSSSAAFEVLIGCALNTLFFNERFSAMELARCAQRVETDWFGKPCGLMDQAVIALGGIVALDFASEEPAVETLAFDFEQAGLSVVLVDVHADHADATPDYASIPRDMSAAARLCGATRLADVSEDRLIEHMGAIRAKLGDKAALRALHFLHESKLVEARVRALAANDAAAWCQASALSAASSAQYLQNVSDGGEQQPAMVALALADAVLDGLDGLDGERSAACALAPHQRGVARIHGGGFGGSIQVYLPTRKARAFMEQMDGLLGAESCNLLTFTPIGAHATWM